MVVLLLFMLDYDCYLICEMGWEGVGVGMCGGGGGCGGGSKVNNAKHLGINTLIRK